jgi:sugar phosphate isomerase/epimerase
MRPLTLGYLSIADVAPGGTILAAAKSGFSAAGIRITGRRPQDGFHHTVVGNPKAMAQIRRRLSDCGIRLSNVSTYHLYPEIHVGDLLPVIEASASLGADFIVAASYDPDRARMVDLLRLYSEAAGAAGIRIALEPVSYSAAATLAEAYDLVTSANQPNLGLMLDPLHMARAGDTPERIRQIDPRKIFYAQICDASERKPEGISLAEEAKAMRLYPGDGRLPLAEFIRALPVGLEIEAELPVVEHSHLAGDERAAIIFERVTRYFDRLEMQHPD